MGNIRSLVGRPYYGLSAILLSEGTYSCDSGAWKDEPVINAVKRFYIDSCWWSPESLKTWLQGVFKLKFKRGDDVRLLFRTPGTTEFCPPERPLAPFAEAFGAFGRPVELKFCTGQLQGFATEVEVKSKHRRFYFLVFSNKRGVLAQKFCK